MSSDGNQMVLSGRYRLLREIGRGGSGTVWQAEHLGWRAPVAVKLMDPALTRSREFVARFEREARLAAGLRSPHVVQLLDHGVDSASGAPYLVMELLDGESLATRIERLGKLPPRETALLMMHVGRALGRAHRQGIVHRDLKPDNVFVVQNDDELIAKVLDFGMSKSTLALGEASVTQAGKVMGTPCYMSPEQIRGSSRVDARSDLWSLGVMACECLTGKLPFDGPDLATLAVAICSPDRAPSPSTLGPVPAGFDEWFARAIAMRPGDRFSSVRQQVQALGRLCGLSSGSGQLDWPDVARPTRGPAKTVVQGGRSLRYRWRLLRAQAGYHLRRRPWLSASALAVVAVGLGYAALRGPSRPADDAEAMALAPLRVAESAADARSPGEPRSAASSNGVGADVRSLADASVSSESSALPTRSVESLPLVGAQPSRAPSAQSGVLAPRSAPGARSSRAPPAASDEQASPRAQDPLFVGRARRRSASDGTPRRKSRKASRSSRRATPAKGRNARSKEKGPDGLVISGRRIRTAL